MNFINANSIEEYEKLVNENTKQRKIARQMFQNQKLGDVSMQENLTKLMKPVIENQDKALIPLIKKQEETLEPIIKEQKKLNDSMFEKLALLPSNPDMRIGEIAAKYLRKALSINFDRKFGLYEGKNGDIYIGNKKVIFDNNDLIIDGLRYKGTKGLWELLTMQRPNENSYDYEDFNNYKTIIHLSKVMHINYDENKTSRRNKSYKWTKILNTIWKEFHPKSGSGIQFLSSNPKMLAKRLDLLGEQFIAGNTNTRNEIVAILDELKNMKQINQKQYQRIHNNIFSY